MNITTALIAEHRILCRLFDHIERAMTKPGSLAELHLMAELVFDILTHHGQVEENLVYVAFDHVLEHKGQRKIFYQEHEEIHVCLSQAKSVPRQKEARRMLSKAIHIARIHFKHEEVDIFPLIDQVMQHDTLDHLGDVWLKQDKLDFPSPVFVPPQLTVVPAQTRL